MFYNQKNSLTYVSNLPYYPTGLGDGTDDDPEDDEGEEEKEEPKKPEEEESTKGYFIKRPLAADYEDYLMETWSCEEGGCWSDVHNLEAVHEHYIDPTSGYQVGYVPQGIFNQDDTAVEYRKRVATEEFDTKIIRQAVENLRATGNWEPKGTEKRSDGTRRGYDLFYHNCQDFADALRAEYYRIKNMKGGELAVGDETYLFPILYPIFNAL